MKKLKWSIMTLAVAFSIKGAFITRPQKLDCTFVQYYIEGGIYPFPGQHNYRDNYIWIYAPMTCTNCYTGSQYMPWEVGELEFPFYNEEK